MTEKEYIESLRGALLLHKESLAIAEPYLAPIKTAHTTHKNLLAERNSRQEPFTKHIASLEEKILSYRENKKSEILHILNTSKESIADSVCSLLEAGKIDEACELAEHNPILLTIKPMKSPVKGVSFRSYTHLVIENPESVNRAFCSPDLDKIKKYVKEHGTLPEGVRQTTTETVCYRQLKGDTKNGE